MRCWFCGEEISNTAVVCPWCGRRQPEPATHEADKTDERTSAAEHAEVVRTLERLISEEPDLSGFDLDNLRRSIAIGERHAHVIRRMGPAVIPDLCRALGHGDPKIRKKSCWALQILGSSSGLSDETILAVADLAADSEEEVREQALHTLGVLAPGVNLSAAVQPLMTALKSADRKVRRAAAEVLGKMGPRAAPALESLHSMLHDPDVDAAEAARAAIVKLGGKVEAPAAGSLEEVERLARLTASSDYSVREQAWADLRKLPNQEAAIEPLMKTFRSIGGKAIGTNLPKFLSNLGTEACRVPLLEILDRTRGSSDPWEQEYLAGSVCYALLQLKGGISALRSAVPAELLPFIMTRGLMSAEDRERPAIVETLAEDERRKTIADVVSIFRSAEDKNECSWRVSGALGALGSDAIEPLLEVLRGVKPSEIRPDGSVSRDDEGKDGAPASALVRIPAAIERLRAICSAEEYERILVRAHSYGDSSNPALNRALGEIASPRAIGRLVFVLWQDHWQPETRKPAREALVKVGKKAHEQLLRALEIHVPTNRELQTSLRREILAVLSETGDEQCIPAITAVLTSDPLVAEDAKAAIETIAERCGTVDLPQLVIPQALSIKRTAETGDPYIDECFQIDFDESYEGRDWFDMPEAKAIPDAANAGRIEEALRLAEELLHTHPDFYFGYYWFAVLYRKQKRYDDARSCLMEGLRLARSKQSLCTAMGDLEWERRDLPEAVKWWIKSVAVQVGSQYVTDYVAFLQLSYVAEALGIRVACSRLRSWVDRIRPGQLRLTAQAANELHLATSRQETPAMRLAIEMLEKHYLRNREE
jgi:HEAT repeat protein